MVFVVVVCRDGDAAGDEADRADGAEYAQAGRATAVACGDCAFRAAGIGGRGFDVFGQYVFGGDDDGIAVEFAVTLHADQRPFAAREVVFDDEVGAVAVVKGYKQVVAAARGVDADRASTGRRVGELVVRAVHGVDLCDARGVQVVLGDGVAVGGFQGEGDVAHVGFLSVFLVMGLGGRCSCTGRSALPPSSKTLPYWGRGFV